MTFPDDVPFPDSEDTILPAATIFLSPLAVVLDLPNPPAAEETQEETKQSTALSNER